MKKDVVVPPLGESVEGGVLSSWLTKEGDYVLKGDSLFELETDKITLAVTARASGTIQIGTGEGKEVTEGQVVATIDTEAAPPSSSTPPSPPPAERVGSIPVKTLSPSLRKMVDQKGIDPGTIPGTGLKGRLTKEDILQATEPHEKRPTLSPETSPPSVTPPRGEGEKVKKVPLSPIRKTIGRNLLERQRTAALLTTFNEVDMSRIGEMRRALGEAFQEKHGVRLGLMSFFVKATQSALAHYPEVNGVIEGDHILYRTTYDIAVALATVKGLLTPVIRDVQDLSFDEIERRLLLFRDKAEKKQFVPSELAGASFTVTNGGVFGSLFSTPIPGPSQSGVLGMHTIQKRPVVVDDQIVIRPMMYLAFSYDHRLIDGENAVSFLAHIKKQIEKPERMLLDL